MANYPSVQTWGLEFSRRLCHRGPSLHRLVGGIYFPSSVYSLSLCFFLHKWGWKSRYSHSHTMIQYHAKTKLFIWPKKIPCLRDKAKLSKQPALTGGRSNDSLCLHPYTKGQPEMIWFKQTSYFSTVLSLCLHKDRNFQNNFFWSSHQDIYLFYYSVE